MSKILDRTNFVTGLINVVCNYPLIRINFAIYPNPNSFPGLTFVVNNLSSCRENNWSDRKQVLGLPRCSISRTIHE
jgi:hypothetical protein